MKLGLASSSYLFENDVVVFLVYLEPDDINDLLLREALDNFDLAVLPAIDYLIDFPPAFDFLVKALDYLLDLEFPVFLVFASSSAFGPISSSSSSQPVGSISISRSTASNN